MAHLKTQSAMEYLMTYGWAILIISVVAASLFLLGVFNSNLYVAKAQPGACSVSRPYGPATIAYMSLRGACFNQIPEFVTVCNGQTSSIAANTAEANTISGGYNTVSFWMYWNGGTLEVPFSFSSYYLYLKNNELGFSTNNGDLYGISSNSLLNKWINVIAVFYNGPYTGNNILYINGVQQTLTQYAGSAQSGTATSNIAVCSFGQTANSVFGGYMSNVQIYNTSITANTASVLYIEGIGEAPVVLQNLAGWWPLNGNANDTSGNLNNAVAANIIYSGTWYSQYTSP